MRRKGVYECQQEGVRNFDKVSSEVLTQNKSEGSEGAELTGHADNWNIICQAGGGGGGVTYKDLMAGLYMFKRIE